MSSRLALILRAFHHRNYRLFFIGQLISLIGTFLTQLATVWFVYRLTHAAWLLGVAGFVGQIPMFALAPFAGVWVDRWNRQRRLLVITQSLSMLQSFGLAAVAFWCPSVLGIILLSLVQGLINAFDIPARQAFLVEMVTDRADLANAIALNSTMVHLARLIGPALAGFLIATVGEGWCFTLDGVSYIAVIIALLMMRLAPHQRRENQRSALHGFREGLTYAWNFIPLRALLLLAAFVSITGMPAFSVLMPIFADHFSHHGNGAKILGILMGSSGLGALIGAVLLASRRTILGLGRMIWIATAIFGCALIAFACSRNFYLSLALVPLAGFGMLTMFAGVNTLLQTLVEDDKRGRVMSLFAMAFVGMTPWGNLVAGLVAQHAGKWSATPQLTGAAITIAAAGALCIIASGLFARALPAIRKIIRPIYMKKGILPQIAEGLNESTQLDLPATSRS